MYSSEWRQYRGRVGWGCGRVGAVGAEGVWARIGGFLGTAVSGGSRSRAGWGCGRCGGGGGLGTHFLCAGSRGRAGVGAVAAEGVWARSGGL